jgi:hypothetical protein
MSNSNENIIDYIKKYNIQTVFDIGCGDCSRIKNIFTSIPKYIGADIDALCIEKNRKLYSGTTSFVVFDISFF